MGEDAGIMWQLGFPCDPGQLILHPCHTAPATSLGHTSALSQGCSKSELAVTELFGVSCVSSAM